MPRKPKRSPRKRRGRGRPRIAENAARLQAIETTVCEALRAGNYVETAAAYAGVSKDWLYRAMRAGARDAADHRRTALAHFSDAVKKAEADAEVGGVAIISAAAQDQWAPATKARPRQLLRKGEWQALAWRLERRHPERWGRRGAGALPLDDFLQAARLVADAAAEFITEPAQRQAFLRRVAELVHVQVGPAEEPAGLLSAGEGA